MGQDEERLVTQEQAEKLERRTTQSNVIRVALLIATLLLVAAVNGLASIPGDVVENSATNKAQDERMNRHCAEADRRSGEIQEDVRRVETLAMEVLKEVRK